MDLGIADVGSAKVGSPTVVGTTVGGMGRAGRACATRLERARGTAEVAFAVRDGATRARRLYQEGQAKIRMPRTHEAAPTAVFLNTAGGIAGGDALAFSATWDDGASATVTSQAAERVYRATGAAETGRIDNRIVVGAGASAEWLPQETILFDGARLDRRLSVDMAADARLLMVETVFLGRSAMGERVETCFLADRFEIRRAGRLVYADVFRLEGDAAAILAGPATGGGAIAASTVLLIAPDAESRLDACREIVESFGTEAGVSAWGGLLAVRLVSASARSLRAELVTLLEALRGRPLPRPWFC